MGDSSSCVSNGNCRRAEHQEDFISDSNLCVSVVTGASEGIGKAYAVAVSQRLNNTGCVCLCDKDLHTYSEADVWDSDCAEYFC